MPVPHLRTGSTGSRLSPLCSRTHIHRVYRITPSQARTLWWWGRQTNVANEAFEERVRRHHKIMRSRYYDLARRRAAWESEDRHMRPWRHGRLWASRYCDYKPMSSTEQTRQQQQERDREQQERNREGERAPDSDSRTVYKDFESFRDAVDRAVALDAYGTIFGRRLQSPPTANNSSWTSFSWLTSTKESPDDVKSSLAQHSPSTAPPFEKPPTPAAPIPQSVKKSAPASDEEYQYDPISGRKVPVQRPSSTSQPRNQTRTPASDNRPTTTVAQNETTSTSSSKQAPEDKPKQPFLQSLFFQEHGVDIPVKTFKPHKVYGHGSTEKTPVDKPAVPSAAESAKIFESSRKQHLRDLMSRVKGNTIDTTALFTETIPMPEQPVVEEPQVAKKPRDSPEPDDSLPLFSGTTYEGKAKGALDVKASEWLAREGFRQATDSKAGFKATKAEKEFVVLNSLMAKLEPSLDRVQARDVLKLSAKVTRLQPVLDRQVTTPPLTGNKVEGSRVSTSPDPVKERKLRRAKLEADFEARQDDAANGTAFSPKSNKADVATSKITQTLNNVMGHIREHPEGIVARTMQSMTKMNENYKKYIRPDAIKGLTEKLIFKDGSLSNTSSIYKESKPWKIDSFTPSHDVLKAEKERDRRAANLQAEAEKAKTDSEAQIAQMAMLAKDLRSVYETEYGTIDANHRQPIAQQKDESIVSAQPLAASSMSLQKAHPLSIATVKPGVMTNPVIDAHVSKFEPKLVNLVDNAKQVRNQIMKINNEVQELRLLHSQQVPEPIEQASRTSPSPALSDVVKGTKEVRRVLHETKSALRAIETQRPGIAWNSPSMSGTDFGKKRIDIKVGKVSEPEPAINPILEHSDVSQAAVPLSLAMQSTRPQSTPEEPKSSVDTLPSIAFESPYLILAFDASTGKVSFSPMNQPMTDVPKSTNTIHILGRLQNASEYLKHFQVLQKKGYSLYNGTDKMLFFQKQETKQVANTVEVKEPVEVQPVSQAITPESVSATSPSNPNKEAATVLEELPAELDPTPGPAAPTAPPSHPQDRKPSVKRQERVFSGTIRSKAALEANARSSHHDRYKRKIHRRRMWKRFTRFVRRTILTITALGVGAYAIGFVAEGLGAHAQQQKRVENGDALGPRKRIVMTGQRPGIYSTESSR